MRYTALHADPAPRLAPVPAQPETMDLREPAHRVSPRARTMWLVADLLQVAVVTSLLVVLAVLWQPLGSRWWVVVALVALDLLAAVLVPVWRYRVHRWEATGSAVYTQRGWWVREQRIAPMTRVQTVDLAEGALARLFGLASVTVTTASAAGALSIDGLDRDVARRLVADLTRQADAVAGDAT